MKALVSDLSRWPRAGSLEILFEEALMSQTVARCLWACSRRSASSTSSG